MWSCWPSPILAPRCEVVSTYSAPISSAHLAIVSLASLVLALIASRLTTASMLMRRIVPSSRLYVAPYMPCLAIASIARVIAWLWLYVPLALSIYAWFSAVIYACFVDSRAFVSINLIVSLTKPLYAAFCNCLTIGNFCSCSMLNWIMPLLYASCRSSLSKFANCAFFSISRMASLPRPEYLDIVSTAWRFNKPSSSSWFKFHFNAPVASSYVWNRIITSLNSCISILL